MLRKFGFMSVLATLAMATPISAEVHTVVLTDGSFFPELIYVDAGDSVRFVNESESAQTVTSNGAEWTTGSLAVGDAVSLEVVENMKQGFTSDFSETMSGALNFGEPDLGDPETDEG